jgi:hypothetical protein
MHARPGLLTALLLLGALAVPGAVEAAGCGGACGIFRDACRSSAALRMRVCKRRCASAACRAGCRAGRAAVFGSCRGYASLCRAACPARPYALCGARCGTDARQCLRKARHDAGGCLGRCGRERSTGRLDCRERCALDLDTRVARCLRASPLCARAVNMSRRACQAACPADAGRDRARCRTACSREAAATRRTCRAEPEEGLLACTSRCTSSRAGAFLAPPD